ncbi:type I-E CRISPR-associated protein Cas5/CasD [Bombiscardovia coagulans]
MRTDIMQYYRKSKTLVNDTRREPTKSGVIGLLASAQGRSREDEIEDLVELEFGVRVEQRGRIIRDFQTEKTEKGKSMPLTNRYYLADAAFLVALSGNDELLISLDSALRSPKWPLFLGRRSCPATLPITLGIHDEYEDVRDALCRESWHAASWYKRRYHLPDLDVACDAHEGEISQNQADTPLSFSMKQRRYANRAVHHFRVPNPDSVHSEEVKSSDSMGFPDVTEESSVDFMFFEEM